MTDNRSNQQSDRLGSAGVCPFALARAMIVAVCLFATSTASLAAEPPPQMAAAEVLLTVRPAERFSVTGDDDIVRLKHLASGVGWEFSRTEATTQALKRIGIKTIRCINVGLPGHFAEDGRFVVDEPNHLLAHLATCRELNARPHVIIAQTVPPALRLGEQDLPPKERGLMGSQLSKVAFGPTDWKKFREYCRAHFEYVLVTKGFADAEFEVGNEPDIGGVVARRPPKPPNGSLAAYKAYLAWYRNVAQAAVEFEREHPALKVRLGGPALAWAFTFKFGECNWASRFLQDCGQQKIKLDFIGLHFYGNISSLGGEYPATYPSFTAMLADTQRARDKYVPGTPICITEWGPSYVCDNSPASRVNANHVGTAWSAAFLNSMLAHGVDSALYLVTTDSTQPNAAGKLENVWGWPALFVNPQVFGEAYPKSTYHLFGMIHHLTGQRVAVDVGKGSVAAIAVADAQRHSLQLLVWNFAANLPEHEPAKGATTEAPLCIRIADAQRFFGARQVAARAWLIGVGVSDAASVFDRGEALNRKNTALREVEGIAASVAPEGVVVRYTLPPLSVCLIELNRQGLQEKK